MFACRKLAQLAVVVGLLGECLSVLGHGFVREITLGSSVHPGYHPFVDSWWTPPPQRIVRKVPGISPIEDLTLIDVQCNGNTAANYFTEPAPLVGQVSAGETVKLEWLNYAGDNHKGPLLTYLARAPSNADITRWNPGTDAVWFKVKHDGKDEEGKWAAPEMFSTHNSTYEFRIPANLIPGQYLIRHEWIALHFAESYPGVQLYPACVQIEVTGNGTAFPSSFVSFPGAYTQETPGMIFDVWNDGGVPYPLPGPDVWTGGN
ncbi:glycoside hydrolase [Coprinopsis marcescibilis]|uniref:lytic cellulose monooxygenase (C4-dehydrogenating) n=1 Tax=Coprinopsis marcescibilis TaxID=230819 RepID=A0A5C3L0R0_COPMA|nr:glycoside hydrolase [Coprinopsis marcescibilis]